MKLSLPRRQAEYVASDASQFWWGAGERTDKVLVDGPLRDRCR